LVLVLVLVFAGYTFATEHDFLERWGRLVICLLGGAYAIRALLTPPGLRLYSLGFEVRKVWTTKRYAWTAVSPFSLMPGWIEFRVNGKSDLEAAENIPIGLLSTPIDEACRTLNAFRQRALEFPNPTS
jgi:hypothetical protein